MTGVIGLLTAPPGRPMRPLSLSGSSPFGERTEQFATLSTLARRHGALLYVFSPAEVDWAQRRVRAAVFRAGRWEKRLTPLPQVVYNRLPSRLVEAHPLCRDLKGRLRKLGIPLFNPGFFDKWRNHRLLSQHPDLRRHLPYAETFGGSSRLEALLGRFGRLYVKPIHGHAGSGIMLLESGDSGHTLRRLDRGSVYTTRFPEARELARAASRLARSQPYLMQEAVPVARYRGRTFDFRLLVHKTPEGLWRVTGVGMRVAARGGITTHVPNGGSLASPHDVLRQVFGQSLRQKDGIYRRTRRLALLVAQTLDRQAKSGLVEMSLDMTVSPAGHLWFFEANAKPMRFDEPRIQSRWRRRLIRYLLSQTKGQR